MSSLWRSSRFSSRIMNHSATTTGKPNSRNSAVIWSIVDTLQGYHDGYRSVNNTDDWLGIVTLRSYPTASISSLKMPPRTSGRSKAPLWSV